MKRLFALLFLLFIFIGCNENRVFYQFDKSFESNRWAFSNVKEYTFTIEDDSNPHTIFIHLSHVYGYQFPTVPLVITLQYPDGTTENRNLDAQILDENGKDLGDCVGDICDLKVIFEENKMFPKGTYILKLTNDAPNGFLPNIIGVGISVESEKE